MSFSLRRLMIAFIVLGAGFAACRLLLQGNNPTCKSSFQLTDCGLQLRGSVHGRDAELHRIVVIDATTGDLIARHIPDGSNDSIDVCVSAAGADGLQMKRIFVQFIGSYVPLWPPALSGWETEYDIELVNNNVHVLAKRDM